MIKSMGDALLKKQQINIEEFIDEFLGNFLSAQTIRAYSIDMQNFFLFAKDNHRPIHHPADIVAWHFQAYRDFLMAEDYSSSTINRKLVAIRSFVKWAIAHQYMQHNPLDAIKLPKVQTQSQTIALDDEEVIQMIQSVVLKDLSGHMHRLAMILMFELGLRRSELTHIRLQDIFQERHHMVIKIRGKGDKERLLPLSTSIQNEIKAYLAFCQHKQITLSPEDFLLMTEKSSQTKKAVDGSTILRMIKNYARKCGINKRISPHSARATAISHLLDTQNIPIRDVAIFAGHSNITTTERYDKRRESLDKSAAYKIHYPTIKDSN